MIKNPLASPEFGVYRISKNYINHLRKTNSRIIDPEETDIYCGPVYRRETNHGCVDYFVPVDVKTFNSTQGFLMNFRDGIYGGLFNFNLMIPCSSAHYKIIKSEARLTDFCLSEKHMLEDCADFVLSGTVRQD